MANTVREVWAAGEPYEQYVGRWSRAVAQEFLAWLAIPAGQTWGDIGCGTGALTATALAAAAPHAVLAVDRSVGFLSFARQTTRDQRVRVVVGDATALPLRSGRCAVTVSGLMLNFVPDPIGAVREMARVTRREGQVAAYVWDYQAGMEMMRHFWDAAVAEDPAAEAIDEGARFGLCQPEPLTALFAEAGLREVAVRSIVIPTAFRDFDAYWAPFLGGQGSAPTYVASLDPEARERLRRALQARLPPAPDGSIILNARAWAVKGAV